MHTNAACACACCAYSHVGASIHVLCTWHAFVAEMMMVHRTASVSALLQSFFFFFLCISLNINWYISHLYTIVILIYLLRLSILLNISVTHVPAVASATPAVVVMDLGAGVASDGTGLWELSNSDRSIVVPAEVPGVVHLDLLLAGRIHEPYFR